jgi:hypothetical protein
VNRLELAAVAAFPELGRLVELKTGSGWVFHPVVMDGEIVLLAGWRVWLAGGWSDAIAIRDRGDAKAYRCDAEGGEVWEREGSLVEVTDALIELPAPDEPGAPKLVKGRRPVIWTP